MDFVKVDEITFKPYVICKEVHDIKMEMPAVEYTDGTFSEFPRMWRDGIELKRTDKIAIALADGFNSLEVMFAWFEKTHGLPFHGQLIKW